MNWRLGRESSNVEDDRGSSGGGFGGRGLAVGGGLGTLLIAAIALLLGKNPGAILGSSNSSSDAPQTEQRQLQPGADDEGRQFVSHILAETEDVWGAVFPQQLQRDYVPPKLHLFRDAVQSGCGNASSQTGPFYCPLDSKVYLDLSFFDELSSRFGATGDFARAYVIAHEVGHHVQNLLGISDKVRRLQEQTDERGANRLSVKLELQADFLAGVWARNSKNLQINERDIQDGLNAASAIGDDKLQQETQGRVVPDAFTHGTSQQRMYWFKKGFESGKVADGDTFGDELAIR